MLPSRGWAFAWFALLPVGCDGDASVGETPAPSAAGGKADVADGPFSEGEQAMLLARINQEECLAPDCDSGLMHTAIGVGCERSTCTVTFESRPHARGYTDAERQRLTPLRRSATGFADGGPIAARIEASATNDNGAIRSACALTGNYADPYSIIFGRTRPAQFVEHVRGCVEILDLMLPRPRDTDVLSAEQAKDVANTLVDECPDTFCAGDYGFDLSRVWCIEGKCEVFMLANSLDPFAPEALTDRDRGDRTRTDPERGTEAEVLYATVEPEGTTTAGETWLGTTCTFFGPYASAADVLAESGPDEPARLSDTAMDQFMECTFDLEWLLGQIPRAQ